jgi:eukaryotic-like serine/threonine-protein kinase
VNDEPRVPPTGFTSLAPGDHLGPYEVVGLIGSGGMGEVYRAHDPRLGRPVALKILRDSTHDAEHVARFAREARAAGSLNHPNIVAVYDVAREGGVPYVVTELLEGETLRARLNRGPIPYRKAVDYGIQMAQALDAAHGKGIWHRDVKPANIFLTDDGRVKLLDFGIAKLSEREMTSGPRDTTVESTQAGEIRGTAGYMSPEQVLGDAVDHRSDIFALGAILYEMFTGARAFQRPSNVETMNAVLQEDPADPLVLKPKLPHAAAAIVGRCLEKNKEERFQSARDLAFDLQQLREQTTSTRALVALPTPFRRKALPALLAVAVLTALALGTVLILQPPQPPPPTFEQLTFRRGRIGGARFAADGLAVIYSEARQGNDLAVWRLDLTDTTPRALEYPGGTDLLAVHAGELALSLRRRFMIGERFVGTLAVVKMGAGSPRPVGENVEDADWNPVGGELAVVRSAGDMSGPSQIEYPIGTTLYPTDGSIRFLRFSPNGQHVAFVEDSTSRGVGGRIGVINVGGDRTRTFLTDRLTSVRGLAWSPRGDEIWFAGGAERMSRALRAIGLDKKARLIYEAPGSLTLWDIAPDGRVLLTRDEERRTVMGVAPGEKVERDLSWFDNAGIADISDDGLSVLIGDRGGVYLRPTNGGPPTHQGIVGFGDDISADGTMVLATVEGASKLVVLRKGADKPQPLPHFRITSYNGARFLSNGQKVLFVGKEEDSDLRSYLQNISGGEPAPITPKRTWGMTISPDEAWVAATGPDRVISLWPIGGGDSRQVKGSLPDDRPVAWSQDGKWLWTFHRGEIPAQVFRVNIETGQRQHWKTLVPPDTSGVYSVIEIRVTPTGHAYAYSYTRLLSQLYMTSGLR